MIYVNALPLAFLLTGTFCLNPDEYPTPRYCLGRGRPLVPKHLVDPTGNYNCNPGETCKAVAGSPYGVCVFDPDGLAVSYCTEDEQCRKNEKCAASGNTNYGQCKPESDPAGTYCEWDWDCRWYLLEKCNNGECVRILYPYPH